MTTNSVGRRSAGFTKTRALQLAVVAFLLAALALPAAAQRVKDAKQNLDNLAFARPHLRISQTLTPVDALQQRYEALPEMDRFRSENGVEWNFLMDERTGRVNLLDGGAIPFVPGPANSLRWEAADGSCQSLSCVPVERMEDLGRDFLTRYQSIFKVDPSELVLDRVGSTPVGESIYFLRFQWVFGGVPVESASIFMVVNNGNLIQVGMENIGDIKLDPVPTISEKTAWEMLAGYVGGLAKDDLVVNRGSLVIEPITPRGMDPDMFNTPFGTMIDYVLVYKLAFRRPGVIGTWEALVDAHTGEILRFADSNDYGHIQGGVYKTDAPFVEVTVPFPFANYGASTYADVAGNFTGTTGTCTMVGPTAGSTGVPGGVKITDSCGSISQAANASGLIDFGNGNASGTDCTVPTGNTGGAGNTHAARTQYWNVTQIKMKAISYLPTNTWLQYQLTDKVNIRSYCNAYWDGGSGATGALNFFKVASPCGNTGEIPGVSLHEWGHGMDQNDGSGTSTDNVPVETRADWTALLQTHISCAGAGFLTSNCGGYGNACTSCTGVREADYAKHSTATPWTPQNYSSVWGVPTTSCPTSCTNCYYGPCGYEDHCESGVATQALWDFVNRDLVGSPTSLDLVTAWQVADRLFYTSMPQAKTMYTCTRGSTPSLTTSNGCGTGSIYTTYRAVDDDGDGVGNGTPHAAAIFAALNRHGIACGLATDAANQNETSCLSLTTPTVSGVVGNNQTILSWTTGGANATRYFVFRNETSCSAGFTRIATVTAPTLTYTDNACYNGVTYYYRIQAATANDSCTSVMSNCISLTPQPCTTPGTPTIGTVTVPGNNQLTVSWTAGSPAGSTYNIYRSTGACPGGAFAQVKTGQASSPWTDASVSGGTTYSYKVTAVDSTGGCESALSGCASATATGTCTAAPTFAGITTVTNPGNTTCTLTLGWSAGTSNCSGSVSYSVYRSTTSPFTPAAGNRIASGVVATSYSDSTSLTSGTTYYYIVHAVDSVNASEDANAVTLSGVPTGPVTTSTLTDTFEGALSGGGFDLAGWTHSAVTGTTNWTWSTARAHDGTHSWYAQDIGSASDMVLVSPSFGVGASTTLSFWHTYAFEGTTSTCYDGATLEYSTNGTTWTVLPAGDFTAGAYTGTVNAGYSNPIGGKAGWCAGTVGTMTQVTANLGGDSNLLNKTIQLRWHEGNDSSTAATGWYVDTVSIVNAQTMGTCTTGSGCTAPGAPALTAATGACGGVNLAWTAGSGSTSAYNVYRSTNTSCPVGTLTKIAGPIVATTYSDTSAVAGTTYTYVVRGTCDAGGTVESVNSNCQAGTRLVSPTPTITGNSANACPATTVVLSTASGKSAYQWYNGGSPIGGATTYQYTVTATGSYTVSYTDTNGCSGTSAAKAVTISACVPNIVYLSHGAFTAVDTNGNAPMEAGEKWSVQVTLQNTGNTDAANVTASLSGMTAGDGITVCNNPGTFGTIVAGGTASYTYTFIVNSAKWYGTYACGTNLTFNVVSKSTTTSGCTCANEMAVFSNAVGIAGGSQTATQVTSPLTAMNSTASSNLSSPFTLLSADTATLSYTSAYTPKSGTTTLFGPDDMPSLTNWTAAGGAAQNAGSAHCSPHTNSLARLPGAASGGSSITKTTAVSTVGLTNIQVTFDYWVSSTLSSTACRLDWSSNNGSTWTTGAFSGTSTTSVCSNTVTLPAGAGGVSQLKIRFVNPGTSTTRYAYVDYVSITGTSGTGSWTANAQVSLVDPSSTVTVLKAYGAADAQPYNVKALYTGPGTYQIRLAENNGGTASLSSGSMNVVLGGTCGTWTAGCCTPPGAPVINSITDVNPCAVSGIQVNYTTGSGASSHNLLKDGAVVVTGYASGATYLPGDTASHTYVVRAVNGSCTTDSTGVSAADATCTAPAEVATGTSLASAQTWTDKNTQTWPVAAGTVSGYRLYRGKKADLPNLLVPSTDSCKRFEGASNAATTADNPTTLPVGDFYWYLVTAYNGAGEGPAGNASDSACGTPPCVRTINSSGTCP
jgi:trimeric autotransporter adhesin